MNRRFFIKALATLPLLVKYLPEKPPPVFLDRCRNDGTLIEPPTEYWTVSTKEEFDEAMRKCKQGARIQLTAGHYYY